MGDVFQSQPGIRPSIAVLLLHTSLDHPQFHAISKPQRVSSDVQHRIARLLCAQVQRSTTSRAATRTTAPHPVGGNVGMTKMQAHFGRCNAQTLGHRIGQRSFITLPRRTQAHRCIDPTRGLDANPRRLMARARNAGRLVELRTIGGGLHYVAKANSQPAPLRACMSLPLAQRGVVQGSQHGLHGGSRCHVIQNLAGGHGIGQLIGPQHVDAAHRHRIQAQLTRHSVQRAVHYPTCYRHGRAHRGVAHLIS